jgi:putative transposase
MSRKGNCLDNAVAESFFSRLKTEFSDGSEYKDVRYFIKKLDEWIHWYNKERIKESLLGMSPVEYRKVKNPPALDFVQV